MSNRKCEGKASYPGLTLYSLIDRTRKDCGIGPDESAEHWIVVTNASTLTYQIRCYSTCDKDYLEYIDADQAERNVWDSTFTAPWRWDDASRVSRDTARIAAKDRTRAVPDREIDVEIVCEAANYSPVGPFKILLQVNIEDA